MAKRKKRFMEKKLSELENKLDKVEKSIGILEDKFNISTPETKVIRKGIKVGKVIRKSKGKRKLTKEDIESELF